MVTLEKVLWHSAGYDTAHIDQPSEADITEAVRQLDGRARNDLYLWASTGPWMGIAGGPGEVMVTYAEDEEGPFYEAASGPEKERAEPVRIRVGGQDVEIPPHLLLAPEDAITAAITFVATEHRPETLDWLPR